MNLLIGFVKKRIWEIEKASVGEILWELFYTVSHYVELALAQTSIDNKIAREYQNN